MLYNIIATTDIYHGSRHVGFSPNRERTLAVKPIEKNLSYEEACSKMLDLLNDALNTDSLPTVSSWEEGVNQCTNYCGITPKPRFRDGTLAFEWDTFTFSMEATN